MLGFLDRYLQGECQQVWDQLGVLGEDVHTATIYPDALAVAHETMRRMRHNIEVLIPRLEALGYHFGYAWMPLVSPADIAWVADQPARFTPPPEDISQHIERFEELTGTLPLSLRAFYSEVGTVNFVGTHPDWEERFRAYITQGLEPPNLDPIFVWGLSEELIDLYALSQKSLHEGQPFPLPIAPDAYLKYNVSGSGPYEIAVPAASADAPLLNEWHHTTFVNYLRICLHYGGLPGLQRISSLISDELAYLREGL